jgi:phenylpyruvate tautomerase PptA (4-oxalocrotonate tautomerase family)
MPVPFRASRLDPTHVSCPVSVTLLARVYNTDFATFSATMAINTSREQSFMPLFTVTMRSGKTVTEKDAISAAIHEASVSAGYPEDDHFQRFISLNEADLRISPRYPDLQKPRSEHVLMIEALVSSGTTEDKKRSLLSAIVTRLQAAGTDPNDVMVFFGEIDRASSSFGGGRPAPPVEVRP